LGFGAKREDVDGCREGVCMNRRLPNGMDLRAAIGVLERIAEGEETAEQRRKRQAAKNACPDWAAPWSSAVRQRCALS
jgi:hypothetical protein